MQIFTEKWTDLHNEIDLNSLNDDSNKDGFVRMDLVMPKLYAPKHYLATNGYLKDQKFSIRASSECKKLQNENYLLKFGYFIMNNVLFCEKFFFIKENKYQDYFYDIKSVGTKSQKIGNRAGFPAHFVSEAKIEQDLTNPIIIEDTCYLCLPARKHYKNYGAFLTQIPTQIEQFKKINKSINIVINKSSIWQKNVLKYFFPDSNFIEIDIWPMQRSIFFKKVIIPFKKDAVILSENDVDFFRKNGVHKNSNRRIFLSRLKQERRRLVNENEVVEFLKNKNFEIIFPEEKNTQEIAEILGEAEYVFGVGGAGMFNCVFCKPNTKFLSIEGGRWASVHSKMFSAMGLDYSIVQPHPVLPIDEIPNLGQCESYVNMDEFINFVETNYNL
jgi:hypothetical protein